MFMFWFSKETEWNATIWKECAPNVPGGQFSTVRPSRAFKLMNSMKPDEDETTATAMLAR